MITREPPGTFAAAALIARKDLAIEFRTRSAFLAAIVFSLLAIVIFFFAWDSTAVSAVDLAPGVLWVIFTFSGLLGLHRSFGVEEADRAIDALLASPVDREAVFLGKALANLLFVLGVQALAIPAVALFYNLPLTRVLGPLIGIAVLAAIAAPDSADADPPPGVGSGARNAASSSLKGRSARLMDDPA